MIKVKKIVLVGGGGYATELADYLFQDYKLRGGPEILGFIEDFIQNPELNSLPYLGKLKDIEPEPELGFIVTSGTPRFREESIQMIEKYGGRITSYIHHTALIATDAVIKEGSIVCPFSIVNSGAIVGRGASLNVHTSIGHGAFVGDFSVISPYSALNGWSKIGAKCFLGTRATIFPKVKIGNQCTVDSHSFVKMDVEDRMFISVRGQYCIVKNRLE